MSDAAPRKLVARFREKEKEFTFGTPGLQTSATFRVWPVGRSALRDYSRKGRTKANALGDETRIDRDEHAAKSAGRITSGRHGSDHQDVHVGLLYCFATTYVGYPLP